MERQIIAFLEEKTQHHFKDISLLKKALTHASIQDHEQESYERLEFLGDRVLGLVISEMLWQMFPTAAEGELSVRLNSLVNAEVCSLIAQEIGLPALIYIGADMRYLHPHRMENIYADVVEALIAVLYLEGGLAAVRPFIQAYWQARAKHLTAARRDAKTELQEWAHAQKGTQLRYQIVERSGPDHEPIFTVEVRVAGFAPARGCGRSRRQAERTAAEAFLLREAIWK
ncbi:ribonuclease III [Bartonella sp. DGB2]|uniref:ribonuclease III n=1 Tax=Bartonella sp. DGB2 TaxID=3388426 RepID=UPI00399006ED